MRTLFGAALAVGVVVAAARADDKPEKIDAKKLIGKWEMTGPDLPKGARATMEFTKDGKVIAEFEADGKKDRSTWAYKVVGNKIITTGKEDGKDKTDTTTVLKLTDDELVARDEGEEKPATFKRVKERKGQDKK